MIVSYATVPVATVPHAVGLLVEAVLKPMVRLFQGREFQSRVIQDIVTGRLNNRL